MSPASENPYAPPASEVATRGAAQSPLAFAFSVFAEHRLALLLGGLWLPANLVIEWLAGGDDTKALLANVRLSGLFSLGLQPLCIGVVCEAARLTRAGEASSVATLLAAARRTWGRVFVAGFFANLLIFAGVLLLLVPGLVLYFRYAFAEIAAARENLNGRGALRRSRALVAGRVGRVAGVQLGFVGAGLVGAVLYGAAVGLVPALGGLLPSALFETAFDLVRSMAVAALCALYDEAASPEAGGAASQPFPRDAGVTP